MKNVFFYCLLSISVTICSDGGDLYIIEGSNDFNPPYRLNKIIDGDTLYYTEKTYFVFNYLPNKEIFDSISLRIMCDALNDSIPLSRLSLDFQDMDTYDTRPLEGAIYSSVALTIPIYYYAWNIENPFQVERRYDVDKNFKKEVLYFDCEICHLKRNVQSPSNN